MKDLVKCCNCNFTGKVEIGSEPCPESRISITLAWVDPNNPEVED